MSAQTGEGNRKQTRAAMLWHKKRYTARTVRVGRRKPLDWKSSQPLLVDKAEGRALSAGWSFCACSEGSLEGSAGWDSHKFHFPLSTFDMSTLSCVHPGPDAPADGRKGDLILFVQRGSNTGGLSQASCCAAVEGCAVRARMVRMEKSGHRIVRWLQPTGRVLGPPGACDGAGSPHQRPGWRWCWCKSFGVETPFSNVVVVAVGVGYLWVVCAVYPVPGLGTWVRYRVPGECVTAAAPVGCAGAGDSFLHLTLPPYCPFCARHRPLEPRLTQQLGSTVAFTASTPIEAFFFLDRRLVSVCLPPA